MLTRARVHIIIIALTAALALPQAMQAQQPQAKPQWEHAEGIPASAGAEIGRQPDGAVVRVLDMNIYIELEQPQMVKLFTILGQPVSQMQLPAGTSRFRVPTRGIYILKIGSSTRRITI